MVKIPSCNAGDTSLIPGWGTKIPHTMWCSQKMFKELRRVWKIRRPVKALLLQEYTGGNAVAVRAKGKGTVVAAQMLRGEGGAAGSGTG